MDLSTVELLKISVAVAVPVAAAAGAAVKTMLNGSARRIKETQSSLNKHIADTSAQLEVARTLGGARHEDLRERIDRVRDDVNAIDVRVARIEGNRWTRRDDHG